MFDSKLLTEKLEQLRVENHIAGMSVAVTDACGVLYKAGFGFENSMRPQVPTYPDAMYKIASMTKTITAAVTLRLCQEGRLDLDTPIKTYLPWLQLSRPEGEGTMTLRHLLTHTSGLPGDGYLPEGTRDESGVDAAIRATIPTLQMASLPGEGVYCYSNWGFNLIACVATTVTGKTLSGLYREYILDPLGMSATTFDYNVATTYPMSLPHKMAADGTLQVIHYQRLNMAYAGGGGLFSNVEDMCKWARFLLREGVTDDGQRLLTPESFGDMCRKHTPRTTDPGTFYGLGMMLRPYGDRYIYGHNGNYDPYNSTIFVDGKTGLGIVVMLNSNAPEVRTKAVDMVLDMA